MRYISLFLIPIALCAQQTASDQKLTEALITEVQQLRLAVERSTRTQLAVSQLQIQEATVGRIAQQYNEVRLGHVAASARRDLLAEQTRDLELKQSQEPHSGVVTSTALQLQKAKSELEAATVTEQEWSAKESELAPQLNQARSGVADARNRIAELEKTVDAAIQQLLKQN
jgi:hypothetical protein